MNTRRHFLGLLALSLAAGCTANKPTPYHIQQTTTDRTLSGKQRKGAVGAVIEWEGSNATVDLDALVRDVKIVARREATARQREVSQHRASAAYRKLAPKVKTALKRRDVRYLAIDTVRDEKSRGSKSVMIWDTQSREIVGNDVYDIKEAPPVGSTARFDTYSANYLGDGSR